MWWDWNQLKKQHKFFNAGGVTEIGDFERDTLVPGVLGRLEHFKHLFQRIKQTCAETGVAHDLDTTLRNVLPSHFGGLKLPPPQAGQQYLNAISKMVDSDFIGPIDAILKDFPSEQAIKDVHGLIALLNRVKYLCSSVQQTKAVLFYYSFKAFPIVKHLESGEEVVGVPIDLKIILLPFQVVLDELISASSTLDASIDQWSSKRQDAKKEFIEFLTARSQITANNRMLLFQIAVIVFTVCVSGLFLVLNDPFSLNKQNNELKLKTASLEDERNNLDFELQKTKQELNLLKTKQQKKSKGR